MPTVQLDDRALVLVTGDDAETLLQNIVTTDLDSLRSGEAKPGALLSPQGKILFDFLISRIESGLRLDCRADVADDLIKRLTLYRLRAKIQISKDDQALVAVSWGDDSGPSRADSGLRDARFATVGVARHYGRAADGAGIAEWNALRAAHGIAESGTDYALGDAFPHDVLLDQTGGVGLHKGCYVGQEVVSRMQHRGTARRRVLIATGAAALPAPGTEILANGRPLGTLGTVAGRTGLAIVRIDRVKDAMVSGNPVTADGIELDLSIPSWATFTFPSEATPAEGA
jgi:folate-binding protein YgfZ